MNDGKKICFIFNKPALYRETIYRAMEDEFSADWFFGISRNGLNLFDPSSFNSYQTLDSVEKYGFKWTKGLIKLLFSYYDNYLMVGETRDISGYVFLMLNKFLFRKKNIYVWTHGWYGKENMKERILKKLYFKMTSGVFLYGNYAKECMINEGFDPKKLFVIHNSLNYKAQLALRQSMTSNNIFKDYFCNDMPTICFIGRLKEVKRLDLIIEALAILKERGLIYNLILIGSGECEQLLKLLVNSHNLNNQVWFYGECFDETENAELIYNSDLCVSPGNVGLTAIHTLMFGCPVITHNDKKWQMPEFESIKEGLTGVFFDKGNVTSLADAIERWFHQHYDDREVIRQNCYDEIDNYWNPNFQIRVLKEGIKYV